MTRKAKRIVSFAVALVSILSLTFYTSAHEVGSGRSYRWYNIQNLPVNADQASRISSSYIQDAFNEWNTKTGVTTFHWSSYSNSKVDFCTPDPYNEWEFGFWTQAQTVLRNSENRWSKEWGTVNIGGFTSGTAIYAAVFINMDLTNNNSSKTYVTKHELGHVLGLGHAPNTVSIMYPEDGVYTSVQQHDVNDIRNWYG